MKIKLLEVKFWKYKLSVIAAYVIRINCQNQLSYRKQLKKMENIFLKYFKN